MISIGKVREISGPQISYFRATIQIAEHRVATRPSVLRSVLGSCVSVCLYDNVTKIGGMTHILLPDSLESKTKTFKPGKFADTAIKTTLKHMGWAGASKRDIVAKIAGGSNMIDQAQTFAMGKKNINASRETLKDEGIRILAEDVGGKLGRHVEFYTDSGTVEVKLRKENAELVKYL
jgi:chemotaxis protein CheD